ncbi:hypothetical protein [Lysobacter sp. CA196]|uniref:hypothetical protein n=1 Tax=Lysobacter sp. CA196 TaxID=3455606 RepID=UPI003F8D8BF2
MIQLENEMIVLRRFFEPSKTAPYGPVIWEPEESDPNAAFKRSLVDKAMQVIAAGDNSLAGACFTMPEFAESEFDAIGERLFSDPEERTYLELALTCESVVKILRATIA